MRKRFEPRLPACDRAGVRLWQITAIGLVALGGCAALCACGAKRADPPAQPAVPAAAPAQPAQPVIELPTAPHPAWSPVPDSPLAKSLHAAQALIERDRMFDKLTKEDDLRSVLGAKIGEFAAEEEASSTISNDPAAPLAAAARNYKSGAVALRVKIMDTGLLPSARHAVSSHLTLIGNDAAGNEAGAFVRGYPAVLGHSSEQETSRASALIGERYLVQITVSGSAQSDAAQHVLEALDWSRLAPKQGKPPSP